MNYIYDILLNFNNVAYDFFEWNDMDTILHVRKIPVIRVSPITLLEIRDYDISFDTPFLESIREKTEVFQKRNVNKVEEACLLSDGATAIAIMIRNNQLLRSRLLMDEEEEVLSISSKLQVQELIYQKKKKINYNIYKTRRQIEVENKLKKELNNLFEKMDLDTIKYIYYECFNKKENNVNVMRKDFCNMFSTSDGNYVTKLKNIFNLLKIKY